VITPLFIFDFSRNPVFGFLAAGDAEAPPAAPLFGILFG
jgi:hypothetical protein